MIFYAIKTQETRKSQQQFKKLLGLSSSESPAYESNGDRNKTLSTREYLDETKPYLKNLISNIKKSDT